VVALDRNGIEFIIVDRDEDILRVFVATALIGALMRANPSMLGSER